jgi:hypothetical protein
MNSTPARFRAPAIAASVGASPAYLVDDRRLMAGGPRQGRAEHGKLDRGDEGTQLHRKTGRPSSCERWSLTRRFEWASSHAGNPKQSRRPSSVVRQLVLRSEIFQFLRERTIILNQGAAPNLLRHRRRSQFRHHLSSGSNWAGSTGLPFPRFAPEVGLIVIAVQFGEFKALPLPTLWRARKRPEVDKNAIHMSKPIRSTASATGLRSADR